MSIQRRIERLESASAAAQPEDTIIRVCDRDTCEGCELTPVEFESSLTPGSPASTRVYICEPEAGEGEGSSATEGQDNGPA
jgi:hypothetical protein